ncbi:hypothetical protein BJV78DRAFT_1136092, partial [Lactifluus subvellereus]
FQCLANIMIAYINVFNLLFLNWIGTHKNGSLVVTTEWYWCKIKSYFSQSHQCFVFFSCRGLLSHLGSGHTSTGDGGGSGDDGGGEGDLGCEGPKS